MRYIVSTETVKYIFQIFSFLKGVYYLDMLKISRSINGISMFYAHFRDCTGYSFFNNTRVIIKGYCNLLFLNFHSKLAYQHGRVKIKIGDRAIKFVCPRK